MKNITEILLSYKTDKHGHHHYGVTYETIFNSFNEEDNLNILEVGIQKGGSLCAWKEYFSNSNIYGVDIIDAILPEYRRADFNYIFSDVKSDFTKNTLKDIKFDIIIDDGSHFFGDVLYVVNNFLDNLNVNGFMIIEDCQSEDWFPHIKNMLDPEKYEVTLFDTRKFTPCIDDMITAIRKLK
jgi:hypothetical protein